MVAAGSNPPPQPTLLRGPKKSGRSPVPPWEIVHRRFRHEKNQRFSESRRWAEPLRRSRLFRRPFQKPFITVVMNKDPHALLFELLTTPSPTGSEQAVQRLIHER